MKNNGININDWVVALSNQKMFYLAVIDMNGRLTFMNSYFFKKLSQTQSSIVDKTLFDFIHPDDLDQFKDSIEKAKAGSSHITTGIRIRNGDDGWVKWELSPVDKPGKLPAKILCLGYDIAEEKKLEQQKTVAETIIQAQQEERTRIGNELHDNVNQLLSTVKLYLHILDPKKEDVYEVRQKAIETLEIATEEIRSLSRQLVMPNFDRDGLITNVAKLVNDLCYVRVFNVSFEHSDKYDIESLDSNRKVTLFRIIQEQIKNIIKYSEAKNVKISLHCADDQIRLLIKDDGIGFDPKNTPKGLGLSNIFERTRLFNGKVVLKTAAGQGCSLIINIPFESKNKVFG